MEGGEMAEPCRVLWDTCAGRVITFVKDGLSYQFRIIEGDNITGLKVGIGGTVGGKPLQSGEIISLNGVTEVTFATWIPGIHTVTSIDL